MIFIRGCKKSSLLLQGVRHFILIVSQIVTPVSKVLPSRLLNNQKPKSGERSTPAMRSLLLKPEIAAPDRALGSKELYTCKGCCWKRIFNVKESLHGERRASTVLKISKVSVETFQETHTFDLEISLPCVFHTENMSTGKRLAKRSIIGTRVCAKWKDGIFYSGVIQEVHTPAEMQNPWDVNMMQQTPETTYKVLFDGIPIATALASVEKNIYNGFENTKIRAVEDFTEYQLIGSGFQSLTGYHSLTGCTLQPGQKVYLTYNGREVSGIVLSHKADDDEVIVQIIPPGHEGAIELKKRLEEVRLLESRKSARLMDQDTDFARLADMAGDRKKASSHSIDVPFGQGSRKRRPSTSNDEKDYDTMNECTAALVLMSLSCSPHSPYTTGFSYEPLSPSPSSDVYSWRSGGRSPTPSPPLSEGGSGSSIWGQNTTDEGIVIDEFDDIPRKKRYPQVIEYRCTWPGCSYSVCDLNSIEYHVRQTHLGPKKESDLEGDLSDHEEEFYYTEVEVSRADVMTNSTGTPPIHPHKDMCRPPHEDPDYQKTRGFPIVRSSSNTPTANTPWNSFTKQMKLGNSYAGTPGDNRSNRAFSFGSTEMSWQPTSLSASAPNKINVGKTPGSPTRKARGETKKCRKVYGMEHRELWCTQCKWKKACSRFGD